MQMIYDYVDYKAYLNEKLDEKPTDKAQTNRGQRSRMAEAIGCQTAYVSSVLRGQAHFTLEQAEGINQFFFHPEDEAEYFLLLLQYNRAGSEPLRKRLQVQMRRISDQRFDLKKKLTVKQSLSAVHQSIYYSDWFYIAIHILLSIPGFQDAKNISARLNLPAELVLSTLQFLQEAGLIEMAHGGYKVKTYQIHLGSESHFIDKHHINWRLKAIQNLPLKNSDDLHYSSVVSLSRKDISAIMEIFIRALKESKSIVRESKEEELRCVVMDFFKI